MTIDHISPILLKYYSATAGWRYMPNKTAFVNLETAVHQCLVCEQTPKLVFLWEEDGRNAP